MASELNKLPMPWELRDAFLRGENIMAIVRRAKGAATNDEGTIELSYDLQAGGYIRRVSSPEGRVAQRKFSLHMAALFEELGEFSSVLEAGVGEATTLYYLIEALGRVPPVVHGFDLCWSRVACGREWLAQQPLHIPAQLSVASLLHIPYADNSLDVVFTVHAVEPNRDKEASILAELHRVASRYIILLEPDYESSPENVRARMDGHAYCRGITETANRLGFEVVRHGRFDFSLSEMNPTGLTLIRKSDSKQGVTPAFVCPAYRTPLVEAEGCFFSADSMRAYPILHGIPYLRPEQAIIASKLLECGNGREVWA